MVQNKLISGVILLAFALCAAEVSHASPDALAQAKSDVAAQEFRSAIKTLKKIEAGSVDDFDASQLLVEAYFGRIEQVGMLKKLGLAKDMRKAMERSLALKPENVDALENLIQFHVEAPSAVGGSRDEARTLITRLTKVDPVKGYRFTAGLAASEQDFAGALTALDQASRTAPTNTDIMLDRGFVHAQMDAPRAAMDSFDACYKTDAMRLDCLYQLGKTSQVANLDLRAGEAAFTSFLANPDAMAAFIPHAHLRLGHIYVQSARPDLARASYSKAVEIGDLDAAKTALKELN